MSNNQPADGIFALIVFGIIILCFLPKPVLYFLLAACLLWAVANLVLIPKSDRHEEKYEQRTKADKKRSYRGPY